MYTSILQVRRHGYRAHTYVSWGIVGRGRGISMSLGVESRGNFTSVSRGLERRKSTSVCLAGRQEKVYYIFVRCGEGSG